MRNLTHRIFVHDDTSSETNSQQTLVQSFCYWIICHSFLQQPSQTAHSGLALFAIMSQIQDTKDKSLARKKILTQILQNLGK